MLNYAMQFPKQLIRKAVKQATNDRNHRRNFEKSLNFQFEKPIWGNIFQNEFTHFTVKNLVIKLEIDCLNPQQSRQFTVDNSNRGFAKPRLSLIGEGFFAFIFLFTKRKIHFQTT